MIYTIADELVGRMSRDEMESIVMDSIADHLEGLPDADLENEFARVFAVEVSDGQPDEAQEWHDFDPEC
jgi:hypothetical protein